jgi:hypothetical protein
VFLGSNPSSSKFEIFKLNCNSGQTTWSHFPTQLINL